MRTTITKVLLDSSFDGVPDELELDPELESLVTGAFVPVELELLDESEAALVSGATDVAGAEEVAGAAVVTGASEAAVVAGASGAAVVAGASVGAAVVV